MAMSMTYDLVWRTNGILITDMTNEWRMATEYV